MKRLEIKRQKSRQAEDSEGSLYVNAVLRHRQESCPMGIKMLLFDEQKDRIDTFIATLKKKKKSPKLTRFLVNWYKTDNYLEKF